jgi:hypothetical protein
METMRSTWTDERLDDLTHRMDHGFARVDSRLDKLDARLDAMQRTMIQTTVAIAAIMVTGFATMLATQL